MEYARLASHYERIEATPKRLEMTGHVAAMLSEAGPDEWDRVIHLSRGALGPEHEGVELGLAEKLVQELLARLSGRTEAEVGAAGRETGDLGSAAERLLSRKTQSALFTQGRLTVARVWETLRRIAVASGAGSQETKLRLLAQLLGEATPLEARYLVRTVTGRLRLGIADMTVLDALAVLATGGSAASLTELPSEERTQREEARRELERAYDVTSDLGLVASTLAREGLASIERLRLRVGVPLRPMLAERLASPEEILGKMGGRAALEWKYDGLRIQAHVGPDVGGGGAGPSGVRLFSRRLEDLTGQFPDVAATLAAGFRGRSAIVEGEAVAVDAEGRTRPFQDLSRRRGRKYGIGKRDVTTITGETGRVAGDAGYAGDITEELPVAVHLFDVLHQDGRDLLDDPYAERRARLETLFAYGGLLRIAESETVTDGAGFDAFFERALEAGCEGVMAKDPRGAYKAGARGWQWIKYKADYTEGLVDTLDLVAVGAFAGKGRRAGGYGALLMAAYDPGKRIWATLCKLGTGFTDAMLAEMKERFAAHASSARPEGVASEIAPDVWFRPALVMEVAGASLTLSPVHTCGRDAVRKGAGLAVRFPRFTGRWREDKGPEDATTTEEVLRMWEEQNK